MLFLYRPRQTWLPYRPPRQRMQQAAYNRHLQEEFAATRRVSPSSPEPAPPGTTAPTWPRSLTERLTELAQLHADGALSDEEFATAKSKVLAATPVDP
jgi:Short C-terminal domain